MQRSLQLLKDNGLFALLTQSTYLDKEWARGLRKLLATQMRLESIVDLNPFGQLFFRAMNSPCVTTALTSKSGAKDLCACVISHATQFSRTMDTELRRDKVVATIREVLSKLKAKKHGKADFASGTKVAQSQLLEMSDDRWDLSGESQQDDFPEGWFTAAELLEMRQGVTPGGCLDLFLMDKKKADLLRLEADLVHRAIKSKQLERWRVDWKDRVIFYPYHVRDGESEPAFTVHWDEIEDKELKQKMMELRISDALDFDKQIDSRETGIIREAGINEKTVSKLLKHRVALGLVKYPEAAAYLIEHYNRLESRVFKKRNIRTFARRWYEYLWPRDAKVMLGKPRIIAPTLIRTVRFVLDTNGFLSDHACLMIQPTVKRSSAWDKFADEMKEVMGEGMSKKELMRYCLAFMNSEYSQQRLVTGHRPTPKGSYTITESFMKEIPIPRPSNKMTVKTILRLVTELEDPQHGEEKTLLLEKQLNEVVTRQLEAVKS